MKIIRINDCRDCPNLHLKPFTIDFECRHESLTRRLIFKAEHTKQWKMNGCKIPSWCPLTDED